MLRQSTGLFSGLKINVSSLLSRWNWKTLRRWLIEIGVVILLFQLFDIWLSRDSFRGEIPKQSYTTLGGKVIDIPNREGGASLLYFWGTWCPICRLNRGEVDRLSESEDLISIAMQSGSDSGVQQFVVAEEIGYPVINDESGSLSQFFGVSSVPMFLIINSQGEVVYATRGFTTSWGAKVRLWLAELNGVK